MLTKTRDMEWKTSHSPTPRGPRSGSTKRVLADTVEALSGSRMDPDHKREVLLPVVYRHARTLAEERAATLPGTAHDELVSEAGERAAVALRRLDLDSPPAQQVAYVDRLLRHAVSDACRTLDPLGRGPRGLRRQFESAMEERAQRSGSEPGQVERDAVLDRVVGTGRPVLRMIVGHGMTPDTSVAAFAGAGAPGDSADPAEITVLNMARSRINIAIDSHPDPEVREYLSKVADGLRARRPSNFHRRLGPTLPQLLASLLLEETAAAPTRLAACR